MCWVEPCVYGGVGGRGWRVNSPGSMLQLLIQDSVSRHQLIKDQDPDHHVNLKRETEKKTTKQLTNQFTKQLMNHSIEGLTNQATDLPAEETICRENV